MFDFDTKANNNKIKENNQIAKIIRFNIRSYFSFF